MEVIAQYAGGSKFTVDARGHQVVCDQPLDNGGADEGMTPPEFLLASLATCAGHYAAQYLKTRGLPLADLRVRAAAEKAMKPARLGSFRIEIELGELDARHEEGVLRAAKTCLIHNTLLGAPAIEIAVRVAAAK